MPLAERFAAAKAAGFVDVGISIRWMGLWLAEHDLSEIDALLAEYGLRVAELEAIRVMREEQDPLEDLAAMLAEHFRPDRLQAVGPVRRHHRRRGRASRPGRRPLRRLGRRRGP